MRFEQIKSLMQQVGTILDPYPPTYFAEDRLWTIVLEETLALIVDYDEATGKLFLTCELGQPAAGDRSRLYELMLSYNFFWYTTGGGRLSIDGPEGNVHFTFDLAATALDAVKFAGVVQSVAEVAREWRDVIVRPIDDQPNMPASTEGALIRI